MWSGVIVVQYDVLPIEYFFGPLSLNYPVADNTSPN